MMVLRWQSECKWRDEFSKILLFAFKGHDRFSAAQNAHASGPKRSTNARCWAG